MDTKQEIFRRYFREFDSIRKIARDLRISRITVKKQLAEHALAEQGTLTGDSTKALQEFLSSPPKYDTHNRFRRKLTVEIEDLITQQLEENQRKRQQGLRKQVKRKIDIHQFLVKEGHLIGYTTICNYIRSKAVYQQEAYIRQEYIPGEECEFDWAEIKLEIQGVNRRLFLAVFTSAYSNYRYCLLFNRQDTLAFMESHNAFFAHMGGVYQEMVYDNMKVAVREFVGRHEKKPTEALLNLSGWFQFRWRFCNVRRGNEKGHVERSVEFIRRKAFSEQDEFDSVEQAQAHLHATCDQLNTIPGSTKKIPMDELLQERPSLWKYPGPMECFITHPMKVDKYATICFGTNRYSVPDMYCGKMVDVKVYSNELKIYFAHGLVCTHERDYGRYQWTISLDHYLTTLSRKPGALHGSQALSQAPEPVRTVYKTWFINQPREFIHLLQYCKEYHIEHQRLLDTAIYVSGLCPQHVSAEKIMAILGNQEVTPDTPVAEQPTSEIEQFSNRQLDEITRLMTLSVEEVL
jgi:transposase